VALATAIMTAAVLSSIAIDEGVPVEVVRMSALSAAGVLLGGFAIGAMITRGRK
jgi:hypothetical protein